MPTGRTAGNTEIITATKATLKASHDVRAVVPGLAKASRRWTRSTICPVCSGPKAQGAARCLACFKRERRYVRAGAPLPMPNPPTTPYGTAWHGGGARRTGREVEQPPRPRMIKCADSVWRTEEEATAWEAQP